MADLKTVEEIGLELQKRKQTQHDEAPESEEVRSTELSDSDDIDAELKARVHEILSSGEWMNVDVSQVILPEEKGKFAKFQFRRKRQNYDRLKGSIKDIGIVDPIVLKQESGVDGVARYYLIDGHTRFNILLELLSEDPTTQVPPFLVIECSDADATLIAEKLNAFSENLDDEDRSFAVIRMFEIGGVSQVEIARRLGYSKSTVSEIIGAFRDVPPDARDRIERRSWTVQHGIELARLKNEKDEQMRIFELAKTHRYNATKMGEMVAASRDRERYRQEAKKLLKEELAGQENKVITKGDFEHLHEKTVKTLGREKPTYYGSDAPTKYQFRTIEPAPLHTKSALEDLGFTVVEGEATIEEAVAAKPEKPKMPKDKDLMDEDYYVQVCPFCGGRTSEFIAEALNFKTAYVHEPKGGYAHDYCLLQFRLADIQKRIEATTIYKKLHEDSEGFSLEQMNNQSHQMYKDELEIRKQKWREENLPDPQKTSKKGTKTGEVVPKSKTVTPDDASKDVELLQQVIAAQPNLVEECFFTAYEKYLNKQKGYESQSAVKKSLKSSMGVVSRAFLKISSAIEELRE